MSFGRIFFLIILALCIAGLVYTGVWHLFTLFVWQFPMLTWLPLLAIILVGYGVGTVRSLIAGSPQVAVSGAPAETPAAGATPVVASTSPGVRPKFAWGFGLLAGLVVFLYGLFVVLFAYPAMSLDDIDYHEVDALPAQTQPRLLPRTGVTDNPAFKDSHEIHLVRDPKTGDLLWTGEWQGSWTGSESQGISVRSVDDVIARSRIVQEGFDHSVAGITPSTLKGKAKFKHPFSRIQYPVLVPNGPDGAFAMAPYVGYSGFPFRHPYLKGVLVYHQDGELEDLTPEEAAARPELEQTGRIVPETVARAEAEAVADHVDGEINDAEDNKQPYLTTISPTKTVWLTVIDNKSSSQGVKAIVLTDSTTNETDVWIAPPDVHLISTQEVINDARALPLQWEATRCCDSDGDSYTVKLREVVEPRLAFKDGHPYYMVTVVPTDDLALSRDVEYTLVIDGLTGKKIAQYDHVNDGIVADAKLQEFFQGPSDQK